MPDGVADERSFNLLRRMREEAGKGLTLAKFKTLLREQFFMLLVDERRAVEAIPAMLRKDPDLASRMIRNFDRILEAVPLGSDAARSRLDEIHSLLDEVGPSTPPQHDEPRKTHMGTVRPMRPHSVRHSKH
jgi:hypothetical protein